MRSSTPAPSRPTPRRAPTPRCSPATATRRRPASPLSGWAKPAWQTEWSTFETWDPAWDDGTDASGLTWAQHIYTGLTAANLSAFLYWWGSTTPSENGDNEGLIEINGSSVIPSGRLWAFANYSRYVRPGAVRIGATSSNSAVDLTAFRNTDGSVAIVALNTGNQRRPDHVLAVRDRHPQRGDGHAVPDQLRQRHRGPGGHHRQRRRVLRDHPGPLPGHLRDRHWRRRHADPHADPHADRLAHTHRPRPPRPPPGPAAARPARSPTRRRASGPAGSWPP